jgi:hypothetical protein
MKKKLISLATVGLLLASTIVSISVDANGHLTFIKKANALLQEDWKTYYYLCGSPSYDIITVCGEGGSGCIPSGICGGGGN